MRATILAGWGAAILAFGTASANAGYILTPYSGGATSATVKQGDTFVLDLVLSSNANDTHFASVFTVSFSQPGLQYNSHTWAAPYVTSSVDNRSKPANSALPVLLSSSSYVAGSQDPGATDVYFENFLPSDSFGVGTIVSMNLTVPSNFPLGQVTITAVPDPIDSFDNGAAIPTTGTNFTLNVTAVPEPASLSLLAITAASLLRRRRS